MKIPEWVCERLGHRVVAAKDGLFLPVMICTRCEKRRWIPQDSVYKSMFMR